MFAKVLGSLDLVVHVKNMCWLIPTEKLRALPLNLVFARARIEETYWVGGEEQHYRHWKCDKDAVC